MTANRPRPPITLFAKVATAARQAGFLGLETALLVAGVAKKRRKMRAALDKLLPVIAAEFGCSLSDLRCDHDPLLRTRPYNPRIKNVAARYAPNANDPAALVWRPQPTEFEGSHHVKTYIRGERGQFSDVALIKRERRREREAASDSRSKARAPKRKKKWSGGKIPARVTPWSKGRKIETRKSR